MFGKNKKEVAPLVQVEEKKGDKYPVRHAVSYLLEIHGELEEQNLATSRKIHVTEEKFTELQQGIEEMTEEVETLDQTFGHIIEVSERFSIVEGSINDSVDEAQRQVNLLKQDSNDVSASFQKMDETFQVLLSSVDKIKGSDILKIWL